MSRGADVNRKDFNHWTILHISCLQGGLEEIDLLLKVGGYLFVFFVFCFCFCFFFFVFFCLCFFFLFFLCFFFDFIYHFYETQKKKKLLNKNHTQKKKIKKQRIPPSEPKKESFPSISFARDNSNMMEMILSVSSTFQSLLHATPDGVECATHVGDRPLHFLVCGEADSKVLFLFCFCFLLFLFIFIYFLFIF